MLVKQENYYMKIFSFSQSRNIIKIMIGNFAFLIVLFFVVNGVSYASKLELSNDKKMAPENQLSSDIHRQLLKELIQTHPLVLAAHGAKQAAISDVDAALWQFFPTPTIGVESADSKLKYSIDRSTRYLRLQQPVWAGGRLTGQLEKARAQELASNAFLEEQQWSIGFRFLEQWTEARAAQQRILAFEESEEEHQKYYHQVRSRAREGQAARSDVDLSRSRLASVQAELMQAKAQRLQALNRLKQLLGNQISNDVEAVLKVPFSVPVDFNSELIDEILEKLVDSYPVIQRSSALERVMQAEYELARSRLSPEIYLRHDTLKGDVSGTQHQVVLGVTSSFGAGLSSLESLSAAQARYQAQREDTQARRRDVKDQIQADQVQLRTQIERSVNIRRALDSASIFLESSERQFSAGRRNWQELMNSAREKSQLRVQLSDIYAQAWLYQERLKIYELGLQTYLKTQ